MLKFRELKKKVIAYREKITKETGKKFPLNTLNNGIYSHLNGKGELDKNCLYAIDVYGCTYKIMQLLDDGTGLYYDTSGNWPPIFFIPPKGTKLQEGSYINQPADYYSYEGIQSYKTNTGFKRNAFVFRGHIYNGDFKKIWVETLQAKQWIDGEVNTKGM